MENTQKLLSDNPMFVFALKEEAGDEFTGYDSVFVGVGKVNATYHLSKAIFERKPGLIVNLGSAGSHKHPRGSIVCCTRFLQRDMDVTALGFDKYQTPFCEYSPLLQYGICVEGIPEGICGTGDNFLTTHAINDFDVIDMEAYPIAWVAMKEKIPFLCLKYITDGADGGAALDWQRSVSMAATALKATIRSLIK